MTKSYGFISRFISFFKCAILFTFTLSLTYILCILFGAPIEKDKLKTLGFSIYLNVFTILPSVLKYGVNLESWIHLFILKNFNNGLEKLIYDVCMYSIIGAWLGAFLIPLDWDRSWQNFPIPCLIGSLIGIILSCVINILFNVFKSKVNDNEAPVKFRNTKKFV